MILLVRPFRFAAAFKYGRQNIHTGWIKTLTAAFRPKANWTQKLVYIFAEQFRIDRFSLAQEDGIAAGQPLPHYFFYLSILLRCIWCGRVAMPCYPFIPSKN